MQVNRVQSPSFQGLILNTAAKEALEKETTTALKSIRRIGREMKDYKHSDVVVGKNLETFVFDLFDKFSYGKICNVEAQGNRLKIVTEKEMTYNGTRQKELYTRFLNFANKKDAIAASDEFISPGDSFGKAEALAKVIEKSHDFEMGKVTTSKEIVDEMFKEFKSFTV